MKKSIFLIIVTLIFTILFCSCTRSNINENFIRNETWQYSSNYNHCGFNIIFSIDDTGNDRGILTINEKQYKILVGILGNSFSLLLDEMDCHEIIFNATWVFNKKTNEILIYDILLFDDAMINGTIPCDSNYGEKYDMRFINKNSCE